MENKLNKKTVCLHFIVYLLLIKVALDFTAVEECQGIDKQEHSQ